MKVGIHTGGYSLNLESPHNSQILDISTSDGMKWAKRHRDAKQLIRFLLENNIGRAEYFQPTEYELQLAQKAADGREITNINRVVYVFGNETLEAVITDYIGLSDTAKRLVTSGERAAWGHFIKDDD